MPVWGLCSGLNVCLLLPMADACPRSPLQQRHATLRRRVMWGMSCIDDLTEASDDTRAWEGCTLPPRVEQAKDLCKTANTHDEPWW